GGARAAAFWHPLRALADARAPVRLWVDRATVRRGDTVTATVEVPAGARAVLWTRGPGEPWRPVPVALDSLGRAMRRLGPLEADLYLHATSGGRRSARRRGAGAAAACGVRLGTGGHGADPGARHDAAVVAASTARGGRARRSRVDPTRSGQLAREPDGEAGAGGAGVARRERG